MEGSKVLIMVRGDVFAHGLRVHFQEWGFEPVVGWPDPTQVLSLVWQHKPVLLVTDLLTWPGGPAFRAPGAAPPVPTLLLVAQPGPAHAPYAVLQGVPGYHVLPKPCLVAHLKWGVETLLSVTISSDIPSETVSPAWPAQD